MSKNIHLSPTIWNEVKSDIELKILSGRFAPGERIPSVRQMSSDYQVSQTTAQKVLRGLLQEGIIESRRGVGFFVKPYVREQLVASRRKILERKIRECQEEAALSNIDLLPIFEKYYQGSR